MATKYTKEQDAWIAEHLEEGTYTELAEMFSAEFGVTQSAEALRHRVARIGKRKELNRSRITKGKLLRTDWELPIGSERITDGVVWVKVDSVRGRYNKKKPGGYTNGGNWRRKAYVNWEKAYGSVPKGKRLVYLDGDSTNCDVENLYFTDVSVQMHVARHGYQYGNAELTLAAVKWYELHETLKKF